MFDYFLYLAIHFSDFFLEGAFKGSIFVTRNAAEYLESKPQIFSLVSGILVDNNIVLLSGSKFADDVRIITERFDQTTKLRFVNPNEVQFIQFGGLRDRAPELNIKSGQLKLLGSHSNCLLVFPNLIDDIL